MTWDTAIKLTSVLISGAGLTWAVISWWIKRLEKHESDKIEARKKIKSLDGQLQKVFLDNTDSACAVSYAVTMSSATAGTISCNAGTGACPGTTDEMLTCMEKL